jgi:hypothetical protein
VTSEWRSLKKVFRKYGLVVEHLHATLSKALPTLITPITINGIYYNKKPASTTAIRDKTDSYLLRIKRGILVASKYLAVTSEYAIRMLIQQLSILGYYVIACNTRIIVQEVMDTLIEELLRIKAKLIDFALNYSNSLC